MSDTADKIAKILEDPQSLKMISEIAESFMASEDKAKNIEEDTEEEQHNEHSVELHSQEEHRNTLSLLLGNLERILSGCDIDNTVHLISALMPYMNKHRQYSARNIVNVLNMLRSLGDNKMTEMLKIFGSLNK